MSSSLVARIADNITRWGLIIIAVLTPIFVIPAQWMTVPQAKLIMVALVALVAFASWVVSRAIHGSASIPKHFTLWGSALLPVVYLLSAIFSGNGWASVASGNAAVDTVVVVAIWYVILALVALVYSRSSTSLEGFVRLVIVGLLAVIVFQVVRLFLPGVTSLGGFFSGNATSPFGSWHDLGIIAGLGVFLTLALWDSSAIVTTAWRVVLGVFGVASFLVLVVVNSIDVWYALAITGVLFGLWRVLAMMRGGHSLKDAFTSKAVAPWVALLIVCSACGYWSSTLYGHLPASMQITQLEVRPSWQGTYMIGEKALSAKKAFVFGSGPNTFTRDWSLFKPAGVNVTDYWNVDFTAGVGFIPTTFVTTGFLGILAWGLFALSVLWSLVRALRGRSTMHGLLPAVLGAVLYLFAFHVMYVPGVALSVLFFLLVGFVVALESREPTVDFTHISLRPVSNAAWVRVSIVGVAAVALVLAPICASRAIASDLYVQRAVIAYNANGSLDQPLSLVKAALTVSPNNDLAHRAAVQLGLLQLQQMVNSGAKDDAARAALQTKLQDTIAHGLSAVSIDSTDYQNWLSLAVLYQNLAGVGISGAYDNAKQAYQKTIEENPTNPLPHAQLAQLALAQNDVDTALVELGKAIDLKPNLGIAYYLRSQIEASRSDFDKATQDAAAAAQIAQQDPLAWYNLGAVLYAAGKYDLATQALSQAVSLQNNYANALFLLGLSWDKLGQHARALAAMEEVLKLNPNDASVQQVVANLRAGRSAVTQGSK